MQKLKKVIPVLLSIVIFTFISNINFSLLFLSPINIVADVSKSYKRASHYAEWSTFIFFIAFFYFIFLLIYLPVSLQLMHSVACVVIAITISILRGKRSVWMVHCAWIIINYARQWIYFMLNRGEIVTRWTYQKALLFFAVSNQQFFLNSKHL